MGEFTALVLPDGTYVNASLLYSGLYGSAIPTLYPSDSTIESLAKRADTFREVMGDRAVYNYKNNISKCKLVKVYVTVV